MARTAADADPTPDAADDTAPGGTPPDEQGMGEQGDAAHDGYVIEIRVYPDGTLRVEQETMAHEEAEHDEGEGGEAGEGGEEGDVYTDFSDALRAALKIYRDNPVSGSDEANFAAGYREEGGEGMRPGAGGSPAGAGGMMG